MRKLRPAELRLLNAIPKDVVFDRDKPEPFIIEGRLRPWEVPKNTNCKTIMNLRELGLIRQAKCFIWEVPFTLTDKGKQVIGRAIEP